MEFTITELKKTFLQYQVRILNTPLEPSSSWLDNAPIHQEGELRNELIQEVVRKANTIVRHHNRTVYPSQALRHIAEQIDALYWAAGAPDPHSGEVDDGVITRDADLRDHETILSVPEQWEDEADQDEGGLERFAENTRYKQLQARLVVLAEKRAERTKKLEQMKHLRRLLGPFAHAPENVQPNLVTRDGELGTELEKMKILVARLAEKMGGLHKMSWTDVGQVEESLDTTGKMDAILNELPVELSAD
ncbi:hypothetical protein MMC19_004344 [Ptychographa xylographoides]|nr:hypothetical protein [Ptychographa xylographoides]